MTLFHLDERTVLVAVRMFWWARAVLVINPSVSINSTALFGTVANGLAVLVFRPFITSMCAAVNFTVTTVFVIRISISQMLAAIFFAITNASIIIRPRVAVAASLTRVAHAVRVFRPGIPRAACFVIVFALAILVIRIKDVISVRAAFSLRIAWTLRILTIELAF
jgi:hypothetical protein